MALNTTRYYNYAIFFSDGSLAGFLYFLYWYTIIRVGGLDFFFHTYIYILWEFHNPKWQTHSIIQRGSYGTVVLLFSVFGTLIIPGAPWGRSYHDGLPPQNDDLKISNGKLTKRRENVWKCKHFFWIILVYKPWEAMWIPTMKRVLPCLGCFMLFLSFGEQNIPHFASRLAWRQALMPTLTRDQQAPACGSNRLDLQNDGKT